MTPLASSNASFILQNLQYFGLPAEYYISPYLLFPTLKCFGEDFYPSSMYKLETP